MKEQVSVDKEDHLFEAFEIWHPVVIIARERYRRFRQLEDMYETRCAINKYNALELERLKRLDENVKREIAKLKLDLEQAASFPTGSHFIEKEINRLESLYK